MRFSQIVIGLSANFLMVLFHTSFVMAQDTIDYENIFSLQHNRVAVPKGRMLHIYSLSKGNWQVMDSLALPKAYQALDGNIRKVYMLMEDKMVFHGFNGERRDTLRGNDSLKMPAASHWIRTPYTTEKDISVYQHGRQITYVNDGDEWYKIDMSERLAQVLKKASVEPLVKEDDAKPFKKLYSFENAVDEQLSAVYDDKITFHRYDLPEVYMQALKIDFEERYGHPYPLQEEMEFVMKGEAITAFIYDRRMVAVVFPDLIRFYVYDFGRKRWIQNPDIPDLAYGS